MNIYLGESQHKCPCMFIKMARIARNHWQNDRSWSKMAVVV